MEGYRTLFHLVILWSLNIVNSQEGCREAGMVSCCTGENCQVGRNLGNCFCDQTCYSRRDCCNDIEFICPLQSDGSGDEADVFGSGDAGYGSGSTTPTTTIMPDRPPSLIRSPTGNFYLINPASTDRRLFISLSVDLGHPLGRLLWTHNGTLVSSRTDPRVTILASGGLTVRNVQFSDSGRYRLSVSNRAGNIISDFTVKFQYLQIVYAYGVVEQNLVHLVCSARSYPSLYFRKWNTSSGERMESTGEDSFNFGGGEIFLQVFLADRNPLDCLRAGSYSCEFASGPTIYHNSVSRQIKCPVVPVEVRFLRTTYRVPEGVGVVEVCVSGTFYRESVSVVNITLSAATMDNSTSPARYGLDYRGMLGTVTLSRSNSTVCFSIEIVDDCVVEDEEEAVFVLTANDGLSEVSMPNATTITILDNDVVDLVFEESLYEVSEAIANESLHLALQVCVTHGNNRSPMCGRIGIEFVSFNGTAKGGVDFEPTHSTFEIDLEDKKLRVCDCIKLLPDTYSEGDETFQVSVTCARTKRILSSATVKINDDEHVRVSLERSEYAVTEGGPPLEACVLLEGELSTTVVLYLCTQNSTAKDIYDYEGLTSHRIEFAPRNLTFQRYCRNIPIIDDHIFEEKEVFSLELMSGPQNPPGMVKVTPNNVATVTIVDNEVAGAVFVNGTPSIHGTDVSISFVKTGSFVAVECTLKGPGKSPPITSTCTSGHVVFSNVPLRYQEFSISVVGRTQSASINLLQRSFRLDSPVCSVHLINEGVHTLRTDSVSIEWAATGPTSDSKVSHFMCRKDKIRTKFSCNSPVVWRELTPGDHRLIVEPMPTPGCRRHIAQTIQFSL